MALRRIRRALENLVARVGPRITPAARATADSAAEVDKLDLAAIWRDPEIETAWSAAERRVAPLGLSAQPGEPFYLILLDGDHRLETVVAEIPASLGRLRPGGLLLLHDYFPQLRPLWPRGRVIDGPARAVRRLQRAGWPIKVRPLGELPWPTKEGSRRTSLALLGRE